MDGTGGGKKQTFTEEEKTTMIGKTITGYKPELNTNQDLIQAGTVSKDSGYTPNADYAGASSSAAFTTEGLGWKIWSIDDENVYLISAVPTTKTLTLRGSEGYNNGVLILNEICKTCYTDSRYNGVEVNSINAEDIKRALKDTATNENTAYGTTPYQAGYNFKYPSAYWNYDKVNDELENRHKQDNVITGVLEPAQTHSPKSSYYYWESATLSNADSWTNVAYKDLYNPEGDYWLASRYGGLSSDNFWHFGLQALYSR